MAESWLTWPGYDELLGIFLYWANSRKPGYQLFKVWCGSNPTKVLGMKRENPNICWFGTMFNSGLLTGLAVGNQTQN